jgi:RNase adapter protein RapZ
LIPSFVHLFERKESGVMLAALGLNIREGEFLKSFPQIYAQLHGRDDIETTILFMEASDAVLQRRYSETRRPHPLGEGRVIEAIGAERSELEPIRALADVVIDTSDYTVHTLRAWLKNRFAPENTELKTEVTIVSFGFKYGVPLDADLLFDVRFLPNPHFVDALRPLDGRDGRVRDFVVEQGATTGFLARLKSLLEFLLPWYQREGKAYLTIAIGCTGGRHRSVALVEELRGFLSEQGFVPTVVHRDLDRE